MKIAKLVKLTVRQWFWISEAFFRLGLVRLRLRYSSPSRFSGILCFAQHDKQRGENAGSNAIFTAMHESVRLAARCQIGRVDCLPRSIVLTEMLSRRRHKAQTVLGVVKRDGALAAHAWVEVNGIMIAEPEGVSTEFSRLMGQ